MVSVDVNHHIYLLAANDYMSGLNEKPVASKHGLCGCDTALSTVFKLWVNFKLRYFVLFDLAYYFVYIYLFSIKWEFVRFRRS